MFSIGQFEAAQQLGGNPLGGGSTPRYQRSADDFLSVLRSLSAGGLGSDAANKLLSSELASASSDLSQYEGQIGFDQIANKRVLDVLRKIQGMPSGGSGQIDSSAMNAVNSLADTTLRSLTSEDLSSIGPQLNSDILGLTNQMAGGAGRLSDLSSMIAGGAERLGGISTSASSLQDLYKGLYSKFNEMGARTLTSIPGRDQLSSQYDGLRVGLDPIKQAQGNVFGIGDRLRGLGGSSQLQSMASGNLLDSESDAINAAFNSIYAGKDRALSDITQTSRDQSTARGLYSSSGAIADEAASRAQIPMQIASQEADIYGRKADLIRSGVMAGSQLQGSLLGQSADAYNTGSSLGGLYSSLSSGLLGAQGDIINQNEASMLSAANQYGQAGNTLGQMQGLFSLLGNLGSTQAGMLSSAGGLESAAGNLYSNAGNLRLGLPAQLTNQFRAQSESDLGYKQIDLSRYIAEQNAAAQRQASQSGFLGSALGSLAGFGSKLFTGGAA